MIAGYLSAVLIGLLLGLLGGGGSIMTVPIFVYLIGLDAKVSIALSLAVVGIVSLVGVVSHFKQGNVNLKIAAVFAPFAMAGTFFGAKLAAYVSGTFQLILFAVIMLIAAFFMFRGKSDAVEESTSENTKLPVMLIAGEGIFVGIITGLVGVGGGFMIVPALVLLGKTPMKEAVGTSLLIISLKSFAGFMGYLDQVEIDWTFLFTFSAVAVVGIFIGTYLIKFISQKALKKGFAVFLVIMGVFILYKNREALMSVVAQVPSQEAYIAKDNS